MTPPKPVNNPPDKTDIEGAEKQIINTSPDFAQNISIKNNEGSDCTSNELKVNSDQRSLPGISEILSSTLKNTRNIEQADIFNEMTKLNNELVNTQRQLMKQNAEISRLNNQLRNTNADLEQFTYAASHDLKEPLRTIKSFIKLLEKNYAPGLDDRARKYIYFAVDGAERMELLINDLLEYSRAGEKNNDAENVNLNDIIEEIRQLLNLTIAEKEAKIEAAELPEIYISHTAIRQVFQNLISNAIKYQAPGVKPVIFIETIPSNTHWQFAVKDNGIGIPQDDLVSVFTLFKRLNAAKTYSGTGIGLAICKKIVEQNGGKIWVASEEGKGSTFYFTIAKPNNKT
ncbi:MAG: ATP-binding protein [Ferruginibacter sp.]